MWGPRRTIGGSPGERRRFARREAAGRPAAYESLALAVADDGVNLGFLASLPAGKRQPNLLFAAARYLLDARPGDNRHLASWWDQPIDLTFRFLDPDAEISAAGYAGLRLAARLDRQPVDGEHPSTRSYLLLQAQ